MWWLTVSTEAPKVTDWITTVIAAIGIPFSIVAFWKLVTRDKVKEKQIAAIVNITDQLAKQVQELSSQTSEFKYQSNMMFEHNQLLEKQIEINQLAQEEHKSIETERLALAKQERMMNVRPYFIFRQSTRQGHSHTLQLINKGQRASEIKVHTNDDCSFRLTTNKPEIDLNGLLDMAGLVNHLDLSKEFDFQISYKDQDATLYSQTITGYNDTYKVSVPKHIPNID